MGILNLLGYQIICDTGVPMTGLSSPSFEALKIPRLAIVAFNTLSTAASLLLCSHDPLHSYVDVQSTKRLAIGPERRHM